MKKKISTLWGLFILLFYMSNIAMASQSRDTTFQIQHTHTNIDTKQKNAEQLGKATFNYLYYLADESIVICSVSKSPQNCQYQFSASSWLMGVSSSAQWQPKKYQDEYEYDISEFSTYEKAIILFRIRYYLNDDIAGEESDPRSFTITSKSGITASNITKTASEKKQTFFLNATGENLTYISNNPSIQVNSEGRVSVDAGYKGTARIIITNSKNLSKRITVTVKEKQTPVKENKITISNITKTVASSQRTISLKATVKGNAKLTYKSNSKKITVDSKGNIKVPGNYIGKAKITITASETDTYKKALKTITVKILPSSKVEFLQMPRKHIDESRNLGIYFETKSSPGTPDYRVQIATSSDFSPQNIVCDKVKPYNKEDPVANGVFLHDKNLKSGKTYYIRIIWTKNGLSSGKWTTYKGKVTL